MPETVTLTVPATSVAKGDEIASGPAGFLPVTGVDRKVKYVFITLEGQDRQIRWPIDGEVVVQRMQPTQAEKDAQLRDYRLRAIDRKEQITAEALAAAQAKFAEHLAKGYHVSYSNLDDLLEAQATAEVWQRVTHVARIQAERAVSFDETTGWWSLRDVAEVKEENDGQYALDRVEAYEYVKDLVRDSLLDYPRFTSRSTSQASNLVEDYEREAQAKFVSRHGYWF